MSPKRSRPSAPPAAQPGPGSHAGDIPPSLLFRLVHAGFGKANFLLGTMLVGVGAVALAVAWNLGPQKALEARQFAKLTARAPAHVTERWLAVEFDPGQASAGSTWYSSARATPCVVVEYTTEWTGATQRAFCGRRQPLADVMSPHRVAELTPGVPFAWQRDERGFIVPELRMSAEAKRWLVMHRPSAPAVAGDLHALDELSALRLAMAWPVDGAIAGWCGADGDFPVLLDPAQPALAWPAGYVADDARRAPDGFSAAIGALVGLAFWGFGMQLVTAGMGRPLAWLVTIAPLAVLPWWVDTFGAALRPLNRSFAPIVAGLMETVGALDRLVATSPGEATLVDGERIAWPVDDGAYAGTFQGFAFRPPQPRLANPDAALLAINDTIAAQMQALDPEQRATVFARLAQDKRDGNPRAGFAFLRAARQAFVDPSTPPTVHDAARIFLETWVTQPVVEVAPHDIAFDARLALLRELMAIPPPNDIAVPAGWIASRAVERRDAKPIPATGG